MRRVLLVCGILAMIGCGLTAVATSDGPGPTGTLDSGTGANIPDTSTMPEPDTGTPIGDAGLDSADGAFAPSHINTADYTLDAGDVTITSDTTIDTKAMKVGVNGGDPTPLVLGTKDSDIVVWSVGNLAVNGNVFVKGDKALVIVVSGDMTSDHTIAAAASSPDDDLPGPGGKSPGVGGSASEGVPGQNDASKNAGGGGGAGHATPGGKGGKGITAAGGAGGVADATTALVGGRGGGNGGGSTGNKCSKGGNGGGAIQISATGKITFNAGSIIDVSGGGGQGGCKNGNPTGSGGGGGGAGGLIYLEAIGGISLPLFTAVVAAGGGGGEGADNNSDGHAGTTPSFGTPLGAGGMGGTTNGGNGGWGGKGVTVGPPTPMMLLPDAGSDVMNAAGGGGGGAMGTVWFLTRGALVSGGEVNADGKTGAF